MTKEELIEKIKEANRSYYLLGQAAITDTEYDNLVNNLRAIDPNNSILNKVGDDSSTSNKVKLPITMGSLNKTRPNELELSKLYNGLDLVEMPKLDGLSMLIEYRQGKFYCLYTRGNGFEGQDITGRAKYLNFPKQLIPTINNGTVYIIGEAVISKDNFKKAKGDYKHARNMVGGTLRPVLTNKEYEEVPEDIKFNCSLIDIVAYGIYNYDFSTFQDCMSCLLENKFITAPSKIINCNAITPEYLDSKIKYFRNNYEYLTDGVVYRINNMELFNTLGKEANGLNPKGARAVKENLEEQFSLEGVIDHINWDISKRGLFIPTIVLKTPLNFEGVEVSTISANNIKYVKQYQWCPEAKIKVIRSGGVIPRVIDTLSSPNCNYDMPSICPYCHTTLQENDSHLYCPNEYCIGRRRTQVIQFFTSLALEDVSSETISNLYDLGFNTYEKLITIKYSDLIELEGYQAKKAILVERQLNNCLKNITLAKLMYISQLFYNEKTSLGEVKLQLIIDAYDENVILASLNNEKDEQGNFKKLDPKILINIKGLGEAGITLFKDNWKAFKQLYLILKPYIIFKKPEVVSNKLEGKYFAFTGFRDSSLEDLINKNGGFVKGVSKKTFVLFAASTESTKVKMAEKNNIQIIPAGQAKSFVENLLN